MYLPPFFEETDPAVLQALIAEFPLGALVTRTPDGLTADHIPFLFMPASGDTGDRLIGHVARTNDLWRNPDPDLEPMVIFQGISAYITPTWYQTKAETHKVVPTYNYAVVHVHGPLIVHDDPKWVRMLVGRLTQRFESWQQKPWKMGDAPQEYMDELIAKIVGIEIPIRQMVGKWKASQNRGEADRLGAAAGLDARDHADDRAMATLIRERLETH
jgi:transcriptional regulator